MAENFVRAADLVATLEELNDEGYCPFNNETAAAYVEQLANLPMVEAAQVVHGKWELAGDGDGIVCSACGTDFCILLNETKGFRYCPTCGARMDLEGSCIPVSFDDEILTNCNYEDEAGWDDDED